MKKPTDVLRSRLKKAITTFEAGMKAAIEELPLEDTVDECAATPVTDDSSVLLFDEVAPSKEPEKSDKPLTVADLPDELLAKEKLYDSAKLEFDMVRSTQAIQDVVVE